jgi:hypothetical protein
MQPIDADTNLNLVQRALQTLIGHEPGAGEKLVYDSWAQEIIREVWFGWLAHKEVWQVRHDERRYVFAHAASLSKEANRHDPKTFEAAQRLYKVANHSLSYKEEIGLWMDQGLDVYQTMYNSRELIWQS